jgi:hypothetical protein
MVRAATDVQLHALTSDRFLPIITGFPPSTREAGASVEDMLDRFSPGESAKEQRGPGPGASPREGELP